MLTMADARRTALSVLAVTPLAFSDTVLVVSGYFKEDTTATDKMIKVLEAEIRAGQNTPHMA